jgi:hypothetical protein
MALENSAANEEFEDCSDLNNLKRANDEEAYLKEEINGITQETRNQVEDVMAGEGAPNNAMDDVDPWVPDTSGYSDYDFEQAPAPAREETRPETESVQPPKESIYDRIPPDQFKPLQ